MNTSSDNSLVRHLSPMSIWQSLLFFGIPTLIGWFLLYILFPKLEVWGFPTIWNSLIVIMGPLLLLLVISLVAYHIEKNPFIWEAFRSRYRLRNLEDMDMRLLTGFIIVYVGGQLLLMPTASWLADSLPFAVPKHLPPGIDPRISQTSIPSEFLGVSLLGRWSVVLLYIVILCVNIFGEEFWWRGYVLPRQELALGDNAWILHGLLWTLFHLPFWWNLILLLPSTFSLSYITSRHKNTTPGIIAHSLMNGLGIIPIILGVLGVGL